MEFTSTDIRYRDMPGGSNQSGSCGRSRSPARVKPRTGPPSTPIKGDLRDLLMRRQRQTSQAQSWESNSWDRGGKGHSGSHQSPRPHKRTKGPTSSSSSMGPPRPPPSATATSGALEASEPGHSGHRKRQPDERDRSVTKKVSYYYCCSFETLIFVYLSQTQT